jgi:hypothetical protein
MWKVQGVHFGPSVQSTDFFRVVAGFDKVEVVGGGGAEEDIVLRVITQRKPSCSFTTWPNSIFLSKRKAVICNKL